MTPRDKRNFKRVASNIYQREIKNILNLPIFEQSATNFSF